MEPAFLRLQESVDSDVVRDIVRQKGSGKQSRREQNRFPYILEYPAVSQHRGRASLESQFLDGNVKVNGIDDTIALKLYPHTVGPRTREGQVKLDLRGSIGDERMRVRHVDQIVARCEHVPPGAEVFFKTFTGV